MTLTNSAILSSKTSLMHASLAHISRVQIMDSIFLSASNLMGLRKNNALLLCWEVIMWVFTSLELQRRFQFVGHEWLCDSWVVGSDTLTRRQIPSPKRFHVNPGICQWTMTLRNIKIRSRTRTRMQGIRLCDWIRSRRWRRGWIGQEPAGRRWRGTMWDEGEEPWEMNKVQAEGFDELYSL